MNKQVTPQILSAQLETWGLGRTQQNFQTMGSILNLAEVVDLLCLSEANHRVDQSKKKNKQKKRKKHKRHNISKTT